MTTRTTYPPQPATRGEAVSLAVTAVGFAVALLVVVPALRVPPHVDQIAIDNPHAWPAHLDVDDSDGDSWLSVGTVDQRTDNTFHSVVDQGDRWVLRFSYAGTHTELHVTRAQLERDGWQVTVPDAFARQLRATGQPEAPTR